jgi:hypothetical protein
MAEESEHTGDKQPRIVRGRVDSFALYEITDAELDLLEAGSPSSLQLNFAIFAISTALSFFIALVTSPPEGKAFTVFVVITVLGALMGAYLFFLWIKSRKSVSEVIQRIRKRIPIDRSGEQAG